MRNARVIRMATLTLAAFSLAAAAATLEYPEDNPAFSINFPADWEAAVADDGSLEGWTENEEVYVLAWEVEDPEDVEADVGATIENLFTDGDMEDEESEQTNKHGVTFSLKHGTGISAESEEECDFTLGVFPVEQDGENRVFIVMYMLENANATPEMKKQLVRVMESIKPIAADDEDDE